MSSHHLTSGRASALRRLRPSSDLLEALARPGLVAHAVLYVTIGLLALEIGRQGGGEQADGTGAVEALSEQPFGTALLVLVAAGLAALALWRAAQAVWGDPASGSGALERARYGVKALAYGSVAVSAVRVLTGGSGGDGSDEQASSWTARAMELPAGRLLVAGVGLAVVGYGVLSFWQRAVRLEFLEQLDTGQMGARTTETVRRVGRFGYAGRSIVFLLVGGFLVRAAVTFDPEEANGLSQSLQELAASGARPLLWVVAAGLVAFGLLSLFLARYRRVG